MNGWNKINDEIIAADIERQMSSPHDTVRRKHLRRLHEKTGRNVVAYYSGFLHKPDFNLRAHTSINDDDKNGFMACFHSLDFSRGLDLILHLPGGDLAATETIVDYIRTKFGRDIRTIVPQISMSGGTVMALLGREIVMGSHSNLGPIDPQFGHWPAFALIEEFKRACAEVTANPALAPLWAEIVRHYGPTLLSKAENAIAWSDEIARKILTEGMLADRADREQKAADIAEFLLSHDLHHAHGRHLHRSDLRDNGLTIINLEDDQELQDAVLAVHHSYTNTLMNTPAVKIVENHLGNAIVRSANITPQNQQLNARPAQAQGPAQPAKKQAPPAKQEQSFGARFRRAIHILLGGD
jgi:hypothetical protein